MYNQVDIGDYVLARKKVFEQIAVPADCPLGKFPQLLLWRVPGGWADDIDWDSRAVALVNRTPLWIQAFEELCDDCRRIREETPAPELHSHVVPLRQAEERS